MRFRKAFTLVELLAVIGIITVLIAILLPVLGKAMEQARAVACASNERQIYSYVMMYCNENRGKFPIPPWAGEWQVVPVGIWMDGGTGQYNYKEGTLWSVVPGGEDARRRLFKCPSDLADPVTTYGGQVFLYQFARNFSYSFNVYMRGHTQKQWTPASIVTGITPRNMGIRVTEVRHPSNKILVAEERFPEDAVFPMGIVGALANRHAGASNQCFADGHVERMKGIDLDPVFSPWYMQYVALVPDPQAPARAGPP